ncbi:BLUF domain-containing protein [Sphingomonas sp. GCM10030256]|uniref:BLUF domain-containing protein n=1 Tax=Sphingomonas sp. GCM10030256 TaxID=3273427 RepID=UPI003609D8E6
MHQIVYISTARMPLNDRQLRDILATSIRNNGLVDVSGLLVVGGTRFLQVLEGPTHAVLQTYDRIKQDHRHFACVVLSSVSISERAFGDWAMAFQDGGLPRGDSLVEVVEDLTSRMTDRNLQAQFRSFAELHAAA